MTVAINISGVRSRDVTYNVDTNEKRNLENGDAAIGILFLYGHWNRHINGGHL